LIIYVGLQKHTVSLQVYTNT